MYWIYVLECENGITYIGQTNRLYKRLSDHSNGRASANTTKNKPRKIIGLYKVSVNYNFREYIKNLGTVDWREILNEFDYNADGNTERAEKVENYITVMIMKKRDSYESVRGGKYLKGIKDPRGEIEEDGRPTCECGLPCEIVKRQIKRKINFYYVCSLKNVWDGMRKDCEMLEIGKPCRYFQEYMDDVENRVMYKMEESSSTVI